MHEPGGHFSDAFGPLDSQDTLSPLSLGEPLHGIVRLDEIDESLVCLAIERIDDWSGLCLVVNGL